MKLILQLFCKEFLNLIYNFVKKCSLKNIFKIDTILKIIFLYSTIIFYIILFQFSFSQSFSDLLKQDNKPRIVLYGIDGRIGEGVLHSEILDACKKKGWKVISVKVYESLTNYFLTKHFYYSATSLVNYIFKPTFTLSSTHYTYLIPAYSFNLIYINVPYEMLITKDSGFREQYGHLKNFDAFVDINKFVNPNFKWLEVALAQNFSHKLIIPAYLSRSKIENTNIFSDKQKALITGSLWGCNRNSLRFKLALKRLAKDGYVDAIGLSRDYAYLGESYKGKLNGKTNDKIAETLATYGISLIIHNLEHFIYGIPTNRIPEAIAGHSIIISDKHPFIEKYFKDNVLYFDTLQDEEQIYQQVKNLIDWVRENPSAVNKKITNSIEIFNENFALEKILENILKEVEEYKISNRQNSCLD